MNAQRNSSGVAANASFQDKIDTSLHGRRLLAARIAWPVVTVLTTAIFAISLPLFIVELFGRLPEAESTLVRLGLPAILSDFYVVELVVLSLVVMLAFCATAAVIFWRKSDDWMAILTSLALVTFAAAALPPIQTAEPVQSLLHIPATLVRALGYGSFLMFLYLFPDGRFVPRWIRIAAAIWVAWTAAWVFIPALDPFTWSNTLAVPLLMAGLGTGVVAQIYRYRRVSTPIQRQQTKWAVFGLVIPFIVWVIAFLPPAVAPMLLDQPGPLFALYNLVGQGVVILALVLVPLTIGMSVLRIRLWDIDLIINRTLVYGGLTGALVLLYVGSVVALQQIFRTLIGQSSDLAIVYSTLAIALLFMPLRRRLQDFVDRRFYRRRYDAAQTLTTFGEKVRNEVDLNQLTDDLLAVVEETIEPMHVSLWLRDGADEPAQGAFHLRSARGRMEVPDIEVPPGDPIISHFRKASGVVRIDRLEMNSPTLSELNALGVRVSVPLISQGDIVGFLNLGPRLSHQDYSADDRRLLSNLATQAAPAVRVAQLVRQRQVEVRERERLEQELRVARLIQQTLLPDEVPVLPSWQVATYYQPARAVGGDFYDFLHLSDSRLGIIVGDVADKGMPAALMMASARSFLRAVARPSSSPGQVLADVNDLLCPDMPANMFVTCLYAILELDSGRLDYANAGHTLPYRCANGRVDELTATGVPLGVVPGTRYEESSTTLEPGESLLFYSDGLVEAHNPQRRMFSFPRLEALVADHPGGTALIDFLLTELAAFTGTDWAQEDDVTLLTLHRTADGEALVSA